METCFSFLKTHLRDKLYSLPFAEMKSITGTKWLTMVKENLSLLTEQVVDRILTSNHKALAAMVEYGLSKGITLNLNMNPGSYALGRTDLGRYTMFDDHLSSLGEDPTVDNSRN